MSGNDGLFDGLSNPPAAQYPDVQVFVPTVQAQLLAPGAAGVDFYGNWVKPPNAKFVRVILIGPGGGGGSGRKGFTNVVCCGGGGGSSANITDVTFLADDLPQGVPVYVPAGAAGGASVTANDANGNPGITPALYTVFGLTNNVSAPVLPIVVATGGNSGGGGSNSTGTAGGAPPTYGYTTRGVAGGAASGTGLVGASGTSSTGLCPSGGGSGGGLTSGNTHSAGGSSGQVPPYMWANVTGDGFANGGNAASPGQYGKNGLFNTGSGTFAGGGAASLLSIGGHSPLPGTGGGGGGSANTADAVAAGAGGNGLWGGGGGGGGAATDTTSANSGAGGNGGDGICVVMSW